MLGAACGLHREECGGGGHRQGGPDRGVHPRWHELCEGQGHDDFGKDYIPPPPPVRAEEKKPEGGKTNFDWGANNPEVLVKEEMKDDLRAINVTLPKLPDESTPHAGGPLMWGLDHRD